MFLILTYFLHFSLAHHEAFSYEFDETVQENKLPVQSEILNYLQLPCTAELDCFSQLNQFPIIKKMFLKYNTALPSSAPVERLFSFAGKNNTFTPSFRKRLQLVNLSKLL